MRDFVLVEFLVEVTEVQTLIEKLKALDKDFELLESFIYEGFDATGCYRVTGKISSSYATVVKLQDPFLAERMRVSYIPEDLKEKYRK